MTVKARYTCNRCKKRDFTNDAFEVPAGWGSVTLFFQPTKDGPTYDYCGHCYAVVSGLLAKLAATES